ncbi:glycogen debranching protein GlgX [Antrihabitans sp. YC2-6]|uniref:glycogen debranching protein GlgX n=1 Tax=Antrihabitans sp. YC2-6 TaxID=2799498 RepID=UPI0018F29E4D|nr:glycogen debranching protein GlgX [Antrihabitans sp. YC2-6]MBJ8343464.1 glycogen debranching protein GlgX [Antrihabitans sp. YC2-6]
MIDTVSPQSPFPLGATIVTGGTQFAVHAPEATRVELCLVDGEGDERRIDLPHQTYGIWHGLAEGIGAGQRYGYRVHGPWEPIRGRRCNPHKLLLDPYARQITGRVGDNSALLGYADEAFGEPSTVDSLGHVPLSVVTASRTTGVGERLETAWAETVLLEVHVGSYTARHPGVPVADRGKYLGLASPAVVDHLHEIGVTALELLPVHAFITEPSVRARGMRNHWGYSTGSYFAPHPGYASAPGEEVAEFRSMVDGLHAAGIEVVLDVVYNHTCEHSVWGPTISWRGFDAPGYYMLDDDGCDIDLTGCGNTVDGYSPVVARMVCDSLRYWYSDLGVDGFRFDLASALARDGLGPFDSRAPLLTAIFSDPTLARAKLIAEPWDATAAGYQVGNFGSQWSEWNDKFRDDVRRFWLADRGVRDLASRIAGSEDLFGTVRLDRRPWASVNFVTAHDGFTVADVVSYENKHNDANGEDSKDGADHNASANHGVEGPTDDPAVLAARGRHARALLATLLVSTGTPMLLGGDELGRSQGGNNNAYCVPEEASPQDSWAIDWPGADDPWVAFVSALTRLRRSAPALRQPEFFDGRNTPTGHPDLVWFGADGVEMTVDAWHDDSRRTLQAWIDESDVRIAADGEDPKRDSSWLLIFHSGGPADLTTGRPEWFDGELEPVFDSSDPLGTPADMGTLAAGAVVSVSGQTVLALRSRARTVVE